MIDSDLRNRIEAAFSHARNAIQRVTDVEKRLEELAEENERLRYRIAELESKVDPDPHTKAYDDLERPEKVRLVREELVRRGDARTTGKAEMDYTDVMWSVFDGHPSPGHVYDLMELAANEDGFQYGTFNGDKLIRVNTAEVNDETLFHAANKAEEGVSV